MRIYISADMEGVTHSPQVARERIREATLPLLPQLTTLPS
jgi:D-aminopeptidase